MIEYNGNDIWNKYVLSSRLNESTDGALLMLTGSAFHAVGPAAVKERSPILERVREMSSRQRDDDLRSAGRAILDTGTQQFVIYSGARRLRALNTI